nr:hypothetical protein [Streptomyces sp. 846.5]
MAVLRETKCSRQVDFDLLGFCRRRVQALLDGCELAGDTFLLACDELERHGPAIDRVHQLLALAGQLRLLAVEVATLVFSLLALDSKLGLEAVFDCFPQLGIELDGGPVVFDHLLDLGDEQRFARAAGGLLVSAKAYEVRVDHPVAVLGVGDDQPTAAVAAVHAGLEVVGMVTLLLSHKMGSEDILHPLPGGGVDEAFVVPLVGNALVDDVTLVVGVGQDTMEDVRPNRARGHLRCAACGEAANLQLVCH